MKAEIKRRKNMESNRLTTEAKARFFALYWGQYVGRNYIRTGSEESYGYEIPNCHFLELKSLSQISDEDAIECAKILDPNQTQGDYSQILQYKDQFDGAVNTQNGDYILEDLFMDQIINLSDFLRSRGYALPWMGLTVEEMVEAGWIKLKKSK